MDHAIFVNKKEANDMISYLIKTDQLEHSLKIAQLEDEVVIPIIRPDPKIELHSNYRVSTFEFENREDRPNSLKEALKELVPEIEDEIIQTSFDQIGSIAVIDIKDQLLTYKQEVAKAIMTANPSIKSVYRKSSKVKGDYRLRELELIGGVANTRTVHKEHGVEVVLDLDKAYFSPRLATEHVRIADQIPNGAVVLDMFASLAPFGLQIAKDKEVEIDSLDINPNVKGLVESSIRRNKLQGNLNIIIEDARTYARETSVRYDYIIMNHPSGAFDFLEDALDILSEDGEIFYYDFIEISSYQEEVKEKLSGFAVEIIDIHIVRQSSPHEYHLCINLKKK